MTPIDRIVMALIVAFVLVIAGAWLIGFADSDAPITDVLNWTLADVLGRVTVGQALLVWVLGSVVFGLLTTLWRDARRSWRRDHRR